MAYNIWICIFSNGVYIHDLLNNDDKKKRKKYGDSFTDNDIIDVWLDLKDDEGGSFAKNNHHFGKRAIIDKTKKYQLRFYLIFECSFCINLNT